MDNPYRFIARVSNRGGRKMHETEAYDTRDQAIAAAIAARPNARNVSTSRAALQDDGTWRNVHCDIRFHSV